MTSPRLQQILRDIERKKPKPAEKAPASGDLGAAIESMINEAVQERVSAELDRHRDRLQHSPRVQQLMRERPVPASEPTPPARTAPPKDLAAQLHRDGKGRTAWVEIGGLRFDIERNELGRVTGMRQREESPVLPPLEMPYKASAREYNPGEPR